jgi:hypothetical protein
VCVAGVWWGTRRTAGCAARRPRVARRCAARMSAGAPAHAPGPPAPPPTPALQRTRCTRRGGSRQGRSSVARRARRSSGTVPAERRPRRRRRLCSPCGRPAPAQSAAASTRAARARGRRGARRVGPRMAPRGGRTLAAARPNRRRLPCTASGAPGHFKNHHVKPSTHKEPPCEALSKPPSPPPSPTPSPPQHLNVLVHGNADKGDAPGVARRQLRHVRDHLLAGAAPGGPELEHARAWGRGRGAVLLA